MEMTIDQLAQRVSMSSRNIREWQRQGLLPPPARRGRVGIYSDEHLARIERVKKLHAEGFPLDLIRRMIDVDTGSETDIRQLATEVLTPFSTSGPVTLGRVELEDRLGPDASSHLSELGLVADAGGDTVTIRDAETLSLVEGLVGAGISLRRVVSALAEVIAHQHRIAELLLRAYAEEVWEPFVSSKFVTPGWASLAENAASVRALTDRLLSHLQQSAFDDAAASLMLREVPQAERALGEIRGDSRG